jgi:hypothetical protein
MSTTSIPIQQIHNLARNSILIHTGMDYIIFRTANRMRSLSTDTKPDNLDNAPFTKPPQITIEDPYFIQKSPIFNLNLEGFDQIGGIFTPDGGSLEDEYNTGNLPRDLFTLIGSLPFEDAGLVRNEIAVLQKIKLYTDHTSALFIQTLLSYILLYPDRFLTFKNLDNKSRLVTIQKRVQEKYRDISNAQSETITDFILLLFDTLGSSIIESNLIRLLNDLNKKANETIHSELHDWRRLTITINNIKISTNTIDIFHRLLNSMNSDLICGIPRETARKKSIPVVDTNPAVTIENDLHRVIIDVQFMKKILDMWKYLLESENITPVIISFLKDEVPKIFGHFEEAKPLSTVEQHLGISLVTVKNYLDTFLNQNIIAKLTELSGRPSSDGTLKIFRSLQTNSEETLPDPNILNFLFTVTFILQENPALFILHRRSEEFEYGWDDSDPANPKPLSPRHVDSDKIFTGIIFKNGDIQLLESVDLEQEYNRLKNEITDLDLRIGQVGQLQNLLKTARGIPL